MYPGTWKTEMDMEGWQLKANQSKKASETLSQKHQARNDNISI
jgi:hypothetical protein